jgi:hypothetical protein
MHKRKISLRRFYQKTGFIALCAQASSVETEANRHFAPSQPGDGKGPAIKILGYPFFSQCQFQEGGSQRPADMRAPLAPIKACAGKAPPQPSGCFEVNVQTLHCLGSSRCELVGVVAARRTG